MSKYHLLDVTTVIIMTTRTSYDQELRYLIEDMFSPGEFSRVIVSNPDLQITHKNQQNRTFPKSRKQYRTTLFVMNLLIQINTYNEKLSLASAHVQNVQWIGNVSVIVWNPYLNALHEFINVKHKAQVVIFDHKGLQKKTPGWETISHCLGRGEFSRNTYNAYKKYTGGSGWLIVRFPEYDGFSQRENNPCITPVTHNFLPVQTTRDEYFIKTAKAAEQILKNKVGKDVTNVILKYLEECRREWPLPKWYQKSFELFGKVPDEMRDVSVLRIPQPPSNEGS